jgi:iron(II)-dependent oxidoreductase
MEDSAALSRALVDARNYTQSIYSHLTPSQEQFPQIPLVNLPRWELGHIAWFQEFWCKRYAPDDPRGARTPPRIAQADAWWDSARVPHATRWTLPLPDWDGIDRYLADTLDDTLNRLEHARDRYFFELALYHEDMHGEALLMTLQTLALPAPDAAVNGRVHAAGRSTDIEMPRATIAMGAPRDARRFVFDNEKWAHEVEVAPFAIASRCVTCEEFAAFVADRGYRRRELWSSEGWRRREAQGALHPAYWRFRDGQWHERRFDQWQRVNANEPMRHVTAYEAEAYCAWAGRRLPSEAEWQYAAPKLARGDVWEWTATAFGPFPGFAADPYKEYSEPWFGDHRVIRGRSFATRERLAHEGFRNFYLPSRCDMFVGFRTCALAY